MTKYDLYVNQIKNNEVVHCQKIHRIIEMLLLDEVRSHDDDFPYYFDRQKADKAIRAIEALKIFEGDKAGQNLILEPFQAWIVSLIFGWVKKGSGKRRFKNILIIMGKGGGKSPLMAAIGLLILQKDSGAQVYSAANDRNQSKIIFNWMKGYIEYDESLQDRLRVYNGSIFFKEKLSTFRPLSKVAKTTSGFNPSCIIIDEVAMMADSELYNQLTASMFKREESLLLQITHAGPYLESPGYIQYQYAEKVLNGDVVDDQFLPIIYEIDKGDVWHNPKIIRKANPASFINIADLEKRQVYAKNNPSEERSFRTMNLNEWLLGQPDSWKSAQAWEPAILNEGTYKNYITEEKLLTYPCAMGLDLAKRDDFTASVLAFYIAELNMFYLKHRYWIPRERIEEKLKTDSDFILKWANDGLITATDGRTIDNRRVADDILEDFEKYKPIQVNFDPALSADIQSFLESTIEIQPIPQTTMVLSQPTWDLDVYIENKKIIDANPVMRWNVLNARVERWNDNLKLVKAYKSSPERIDGVIAAIMALMPLKQFMLEKKPEKPVSYEMEWI